MALYPDHSKDELREWRRRKCKDCGSGGAYLYCHTCEEDQLCPPCSRQTSCKAFKRG